MCKKIALVACFLSIQTFAEDVDLISGGGSQDYGIATLYTPPILVNMPFVVSNVSYLDAYGTTLFEPTFDLSTNWVDAWTEGQVAHQIGVVTSNYFVMLEWHGDKHRVDLKSSKLVLNPVPERVVTNAPIYVTNIQNFIPQQWWITTNCFHNNPCDVLMNRTNVDSSGNTWIIATNL